VAACPRCGATNDERANFCSTCGAPLGTEQSSGHQERKLVSVLFVDLVGFTASSDEADPEDVRDSLQAYYERARHQIEGFGGTVEKFIGDAVMAVFGAPVAHGDDAERAVRAGLGVLEDIGSLDGEPGRSLQGRAAVTTGVAVVSVGVGHQAGEALALGDVVNTASRLQNAAPTGRLIVGEETYRATRRHIRYEEFVAVQAKGKRHPLRAWLAIEVAPADGSAPATPMVGREREMDLLRTVWARATDGRRPHLATVIGPPGIGKSRLAREVVDHAIRTRGRAAVGRCLPYQTRAVYAAISEQVKSLAGIVDQDSPELARDKLARAAAGYFVPSEAPDITRSLSVLLGLGLDEPHDERNLMFFAVRRFVERAGSEQPMLLVFEDVHWADEAELDLLTYLASHVRETSVVMVALARPEFLDARPSWGSGLLAHTTLALEPLSPDESMRIAGNLLEERTDMEVARLVEVAAGNPLFLEELFSAVAEGPRQGELPTTVREAIASRIDALPAGPRALLLDASVIGKTFWRGALAAIAASDRLDESLDSLEARDLIRREASSQVQDDAEFSFKHMLIRDAAYATLPRVERRNRHAAVARYVEARGPDQVRELAWLLAHHWEEAGEPARAIDYLLLAAERAERVWAGSEADALYAHAVELAEDDGVRRGLRLRRALALVTLEDFDAAVAPLTDLLPELEGRDRLEAILGLTRAEHWTERSDECLRHARQALELAERLGAHELAGPATARVSQALAMRGDISEALDHGERALAIWVTGERPADLAEHHHMLGDQHYWGGSYERALHLSRAGKELAVDPNSAESLLRGGGLEGLVLTSVGRYAEALEIFDAKIALGRDMGRPVRVLQNYSTMALRELYHLDEARARSEEALGQLGWAGFPMPQLNSAVDILFTDLAARDYGRAQARWPQTWEQVRGGRAWEGWLLAGKMAVATAEISLASGRHDNAANEAVTALEMATRVHRRKYECVSRTILGQALVALRRPDEGLVELRRAVSGSDALGSPPGRWQSRAALAAALARVGDDDGAERAYAEAATILRGVAAGLDPELSARFLDAEPVAEVLAVVPESRPSSD
jgi:class 3 adenylate cyclase/tetratricopeptide (TPR) repeat protein